MMRLPTLIGATPKAELVCTGFPFEPGPKLRNKLFEPTPLPVKVQRGWFMKLYAEKRNWNFLLSPIWKFLKSERSLVQNHGPKNSGSTIGPFLPGTVGIVKQFPFSHWWGPRFLVGSQVNMGINGIWSVPLIERLVIAELNEFCVVRLEEILPLALNPGFEPLEFAVRFTPLCTDVMPDTCHPLTTPPSALLLWMGFGSSIEYAALNRWRRSKGSAP